MKINFKLTKKDYWSYNNFSIFHVKNISRIFVATPLLVFVLTMAAGLIFKLDMRVCVAVAIGLPLFYVFIVYFPMAKGVMKIPQDKLVEQTIEIDEEKRQIIHTFGSKHKKYNKTNIMQIRRTSTHIFITLQSYSAIIIPASPDYSLDEVMSKLNIVV